MKKIFRMENQIQKYDWGSKDFIANLLNVKKEDDIPWAELWMGAHLKAPSYLPELSTSLVEAVNQDADRFLGSKNVVKYNSKLPFLFKVLSASKPLSIQAHPNLEEAKRGFAKENKLGIALSDFKRNYKDDNHKPELICALSDFHAMCGFRPASEIIAFFKQVDIAKLFTKFLFFEQSKSPQAWEELFKEVLSASVEKKQQTYQIVRMNIDKLSDAYTKDWVLKLMSYYPHDIGVISPLFLNTFLLKAGEAIFLEAGVLHAYLQGTGIEIMANSDNVLRGGLTTKNIDIEELTSILNWTLKKANIQKYSSSNNIIDYKIPIDEFSLKRISLQGQLEVDNGQPAILLVIEGTLFLSVDDDILELKKGNSVFITSDADKMILHGEALVFLASTK